MEQRRLANLVRQQLASLSRFGVTDLPRPKGRLVLDWTDSRLDQNQELPAVAMQQAVRGPSRDSDQENGLQETVGSPQPTTGPKSQQGHLIVEAKTGFHAEHGKVAGSMLTTAYPNSLNDTDRKRELEVLSGQVSDCLRCEELSRCRTQTVFGVGNPSARLCFLGEGPGAEEDRQGLPFVGAAGQLLDKIISACNMQREDVYILNCVKCRPPGNRNPTGPELENCWPFAIRQLEILQPEFICCLGSIAARTLLETHLSIGRLRQSFHAYRGSRAIVTYHPAYLLRNPDAKKLVWDDMKMLMKEMGI